MTPYHPLFLLKYRLASGVGLGALLFLATEKKAAVNQPVVHAELIATYRRAEADAAHKFGLIKAVAGKGPKAIQAAVETAAKAAKRRDSYAKKLAGLGVNFKD